MTCIVGISTDDGVYFGADSALSTHSTTLVLATPKIFRKRDLLFGCAGSLRDAQLLQYTLELPEHTEDQTNEAYLVASVVEAIRTCLKGAGSSVKYNEQELSSSFLLLGYRNRVYCVQSDFSLRRNAGQYDAIGSGDELALGALHATQDLHPTTRIFRALEAASQHCTTVCAPYHTEHLPPPELPSTVVIQYDDPIYNEATKAMPAIVLPDSRTRKLVLTGVTPDASTDPAQKAHKRGQKREKS